MDIPNTRFIFLPKQPPSDGGRVMLAALSDIDLADRATRRFRELGYNPIPSRASGERKAPTVPYAEFWGEPGPDWWLDQPTGNVQVMCGARWDLAVIDLDGPMAIEVWRSLAMYRDVPLTWEVAHTPGAGRHLWFRLPPGTDACPSRDLWSMPAITHCKIELKADRSLIIAPPSRHLKTRRRYRWLPGRSPRVLARPAVLPRWLLDMPDCRPKAEPMPDPIFRNLKMARPNRGLKSMDRPAYYHSRDVRAAITDMASLAREWNVRLVGQPNAAGWIKCHSIFRPDLVPSGSFHVKSGYYTEPPGREKWSIFELGVIKGPYADWSEARDDLGLRYGASSAGRCG